MGYSVPSHEYLFSELTDHTLKMRLLDNVFDTMVVDELITKIILPEGASGIRLSVPDYVQELPRSLQHSFLGFIDRPVVTLQGRNLVAQHIRNFTIDYNLPKIWLLRKPLLITGPVLILLVTVLVYFRLDFTIESDKSDTDSWDWDSESSTGSPEGLLKNDEEEENRD